MTVFKKVVGWFNKPTDSSTDSTDSLSDNSGTVQASLKPDMVDDIALKTSAHLTALVEKVAPDFVKALAPMSAPDPVLEAMVMAIREPVTLKDQQGRLLVVNDAACRLLGKSAEEIIGKQAEVDCSPETLQRLTDAEHEVFTTGSAVVIDETLWAGIKGSINVRMTKYPVLAPDGNVVGVVCHTLDRTAVIKAERKLEALAALVNNSIDAIFSHTLDGIVLNWNNGAENMFGYTAEEMIGTNIDRIGEDIDHKDTDRMDAIFKAGGTVTNHETFRKRRDGKRFAISFSITPLLADDGSTINGVCAIGRDISRERQVEQLAAGARHQTRALEAHMSRFLASASHDLRQPLQAVFLFASAAAPFVSEPGQTAFRALITSLEAMRSLLDGLLDISSLDSELIHPTIEEFPVADILRPIRAAIEPLARAKNLRFDLAPCNAIVRSDRKLLARMVSNLMQNAVSFTNKGEVMILCHEAKETLRIEVRDTGIGIPEDQQQAIFDEFHQVGNQERDRTRGLGLGLSVVRRLGNILGHKLSISSTPDVGSSFSIEMPLMGNVAEIIEEPLPVEASYRTYAVVVDDDVFLREAFRMIFNDMNYDAVIAASADEALNLLSIDHMPDVMVLDYRLVGETGIDACQKIRDFFNYDIPGILLTGDIGRHVEESAALANLTLIHKPITTASLEDALGEIVNQSPYGTDGVDSPHDSA